MTKRSCINCGKTLPSNYRCSCRDTRDDKLKDNEREYRRQNQGEIKDLSDTELIIVIMFFVGFFVRMYLKYHK